MAINVAKEVATLRHMTVSELRDRYHEVFGEDTNARNKQWLIKRIAWKLQANAEGDISERARRLAHEIAMVPHGELRVIDSIDGHMGLMATDPGYLPQVEANLRELLAIDR